MRRHVLEVQELRQRGRMAVVVRPRPLLAEPALRAAREDVAEEVARQRDQHDEYSVMNTTSSQTLSCVSPTN